MSKSMISLMSIADYVSLINAVFGFISIIFAYLGEIRFAFIFILLAIVADGLDGIIARKTRESQMGEYLESMADMTSLCIAPAFFTYIIYEDQISCCLTKNIVLLGVLLIYLTLGIIRLASFHQMKKKDFFIGLPASSSTILIIVMAYFKIEILYITILITIISFSMISNIKFPKPSFKINIIAGVLILLTIILNKDFFGIGPIFLVFAILVYTIIGPLYLLKSQKNV